MSASPTQAIFNDELPKRLKAKPDVVAKIGFGTMIHRTAVVRSRADEAADPRLTRPRPPEADAVWVAQNNALGFDDLDR